MELSTPHFESQTPAGPEHKNEKESPPPELWIPRIRFYTLWILAPGRQSTGVALQAFHSRPLVPESNLQIPDCELQIWNSRLHTSNLRLLASALRLEASSSRLSLPDLLLKIPARWRPTIKVQQIIGTRVVCGNGWRISCGIGGALQEGLRNHRVADLG